MPSRMQPQVHGQRWFKVVFLYKDSRYSVSFVLIRDGAHALLESVLRG